MALFRNSRAPGRPVIAGLVLILCVAFPAHGGELADIDRAEQIGWTDPEAALELIQKIQPSVQSDEELVELKERARAADMAVLDEGETACCYARSEKHWVTDPQGIAWEHFHTLDGIPTFNHDSAGVPQAAAACCANAAPQGEAAAVSRKPVSSCC